MSEIYSARLSAGSLATPDSAQTVYRDDRFHLEANLAGSVTLHRSAELIVVVSGIMYDAIDPLTDLQRSPSSSPANRLATTYLDGGIEAAGRLEGHFCAIVLEPRNGIAHAFGDLRGGRRLFYALAPEQQGFVLATKLLPVANALPEFPNSDLDYRAFTLVYGYAPFDRTVYAGVRRLANNRVLHAAQGFVSFSTRHTPPVPERNAKHDREAAKQELRRRLSAATESIIGDHQRVGVFLGGFDSALVCALARQAGAEVVAFTFSYEDGEFNQRNIENTVAALNIEHHWVPMSAELIGEGLKHFSERFDRPTNWPNYVIQTAALAREAKRHGVSTLLTGDGCDEIFLGYPGIYRGSRFFQSERNASELSTRLARSLLTHEWAERQLGHVYRLLQRIIRNRALAKRIRQYLMFRVLDESTLNHLFAWPLNEVEQQVERAVYEVAARIPDVSDTVLAYEGRDHIVPNRLKLSGVMDSSGLPIATPFLHPLVRDFVRSMPESLLRPSGAATRKTLGKDILLETAHEAGLLPYEVIYQPKHAAVDGPLDRWYAEELRGMLTELILRVGPVHDQRNLDALLDELPIERLYRRRFSVDSITSHAASLLASYGSYLR